MTNRNQGLIADTLFVGATRPSMLWGVTYTAVMLNAICVIEVFLLTRNPLLLLIAAPIHGVCMLLCAKDPRYFDLLMLAGRTRLAAFFTTYRYWGASSHSPLILDLPNRRGFRKFTFTARVTHAPGARTRNPQRPLRPPCPASQVAGPFSSNAVPYGWDAIEGGASR